MDHFDLVILGAGSGNTVLDDRFAHLRVAVIEDGPWGGTCVNRGCIPSKMYVQPADLLDAARHGRRLGVRGGSAQADVVDWPEVRARVLARIDTLAEEGRAFRESQDHVTVLAGSAAFVSPRVLRVTLADGTSVDVEGDDVVLAAGGRPVEPDIPGLAEAGYHTSDTIMRLEELPRRFGVLGGGYVGSELAHVLHAYGAHVVQVESSDVLLSTHDADVARHVTDAVTPRWDVRLGTTLDRVSAAPDGASVLHLSGGAEVEVDAILVATGRRPNSDRLALDVAGVEVDDETGLVVVDAHQRTTAAGVWALGDLSSPEPLKHVANQDARVVQHNLLHPDDLIVSDHRHVPQAAFTSPQVASVGLTEAQAREQGIDVAVGRHEYADTAYGWSLQRDPEDRSPDATGFVKLLGDRGTGLLVGAHVVGKDAAILIQPLIMAMSLDRPVAGLARAQYWIHPALTEVVENALVDLEEQLGG